MKAVLFVALFLGFNSYPKPKATLVSQGTTVVKGQAYVTLTPVIPVELGGWIEKGANMNKGEVENCEVAAREFGQVEVDGINREVVTMYLDCKTHTIRVDTILWSEK